MKKIAIVVSIFLLMSLFFDFMPTLSQNANGSDAVIKDDIGQIFVISIILGILVGGIAFSLLIYVLLRFRESNPQPKKDIKNPLRLEISWTVMAFVLVAILLFVSLPVAHEIVSEPSTDHEVINIIGFRYSWIFEYENGTQIFSFQGPLVVETHKLYLLNLTSSDVIHSFYVHDLGFKIDAIPGQYTQFKMYIEGAGEYKVHCAEFCGPEHYNMDATILAVDSGS
ncbi:MAG: cytochrome c oxidase subunit II [Candidatus Hodarchaeota archaeon]